MIVFGCRCGPTTPSSSTVNPPTSPGTFQNPGAVGTRGDPRKRQRLPPPKQTSARTSASSTTTTTTEHPPVNDRLSLRRDDVRGAVQGRRQPRGLWGDAGGRLPAALDATPRTGAGAIQRANLSRRPPSFERNTAAAVVVVVSGGPPSRRSTVPPRTTRTYTRATGRARPS